MIRAKIVHPVLELLRKIPKGKVTTYKAIAQKLGMHPRAVAMILKYNSDPVKYPCYKVIGANGNLSGYNGGIDKKIAFLRKDGIKVQNGKIIDFENKLFIFES